VRGIGAAAALHPGGGALEPLEVALVLPCTAQELLTQLALRVPAAAPALVNAGRPVANVARGGALLAAGALVRDGDELDIVAVVSGG
jgi:sulfur carrier protein ThiS